MLNWLESMGTIEDMLAWILRSSLNMRVSMDCSPHDR